MHSLFYSSIAAAAALHLMVLLPPIDVVLRQILACLMYPCAAAHCTMNVRQKSRCKCHVLPRRCDFLARFLLHMSMTLLFAGCSTHTF
jgi:hypothetical protein